MSYELYYGSYFNIPPKGFMNNTYLAPSNRPQEATLHCRAWSFEPFFAGAGISFCRSSSFAMPITCSIRSKEILSCPLTPTLVETLLLAMNKPRKVIGVCKSNTAGKITLQTLNTVLSSLLDSIGRALRPNKPWPLRRIGRRAFQDQLLSCLSSVHLANN